MSLRRKFLSVFSGIIPNFLILRMMAHIFGHLGIAHKYMQRELHIYGAHRIQTA